MKSKDLLYHLSHISGYSVVFCKDLIEETKTMSLKRFRAKHQVKQQLLSGNKFILLHDITFILHWRLRYGMTGKQTNAAIDAFLV